VVSHPNTGQSHAAWARRGRWLSWALAALALIPAGCANFVDQVTSRDFDFKSLFVTPNPLLVLQNSTDNTLRAKALGALREPSQYGGKPEDQEVYVKILTAAAVGDRQPLCRLAAIKSLGHFKDPRAVEALKEAYFSCNFPAETNAIIKEQALAALGHTKSPQARDFLVLVAREPPPTRDSNEVVKQQTLDIRLTAVRALANFSHYEVTEALVQVLRNEKDTALRERAHESLQVVTGKHLPADAKEWDDFLHKSEKGEETLAQGGRGWNLLGWR
jgi:hypothetical protein